jgi:translation initiation factor 3 subunit B
MPIQSYQELINYKNIPHDMTYGIAYFDFQTKEISRKVHKYLTAQNKSKKNRWIIKTWKMWNNIGNSLKKYLHPKFQDFHYEDNSSKWLEDSEGRDQFVVRCKENDLHQTIIYWGDPFREGADLVTDFNNTLKQMQRQYLTNKEVIWSPKGTYLISRHENGIKFWSQGRNNIWIEIKKFLHPKVDLFDISPKESYLITYNSLDKEKSLIQIWDVELGTLKKQLTHSFSHYVKLSWPFFKWSHDDNYFGWLDCSKYNKNSNTIQISQEDADKIRIFQSSNFEKIESGSIRASRISTFSFSPNRSLLIYCSKGDYSNSIPTNISLISIPDQKSLFSKNYFLTLKVDFFWHPNGDFLCVMIKKRINKKQKNDIQPSNSAIIVFHCKEKNYPWVEKKLGKEIVKDIKWDPTQPRICVIQENKNISKSATTIRIFDFKRNNADEIFKIKPEISNNAIFCLWSPQGRYLCWHHEKGERTFYDTHCRYFKKKIHEGSQNIHWSPCGRYVVSTLVSQLTDINDSSQYTKEHNGWKMYNYKGDEIIHNKYKIDEKNNKKTFYSFCWRPRPKSILSNEEKLKIKKDLKDKYWVKYEMYDKKVLLNQLSKITKERMKKYKKWESYIDQWSKIQKYNKKIRIQLRQGKDSENENSYHGTVQEKVLI